MAHLLLVEDDPEIRRALIRALSDRGHSVASAASGFAALQAAVDSRPDLIVLDLGLPDVDGRDVLRMLRSVSDVPVIVATARDGEPAVVEALDLGADDYVHKPFGAAQLDARIRAVLRRGGSAATRGPIAVGGLVLDPVTREVSIDGRAVELTPREFDLLSYLIQRPGAVVTKRELLTEVWRQPFGSADKTVDVHVSWLRRKLGEQAAAPRYLHTVRGVGVRLTAPGDED
ncbi:MAG: response regulator transcription factor [Hamadaea sp.]|uniref:response regulator transcription factor n=1 Tax=Hamadaea sp. TaxID=2024425 RepID=UPI0017C6FF84|nr:response regulator transcription factor [Hamadaea sp.]NUT18857.1 response regulator transcription factor [Hamadaea sp.]